MNLNGQDEQNKIDGQSVAEEAVAENSAAEKKEDGAKKSKSPKKPKGPKKPVDRKTLIRIICISAAAVVAVVALTLGLVLGLKGCNGDKEYTVDFLRCDHVTYVCDLLTDDNKTENGYSLKVKNGDTVTFSVTVEDGYTQNPRVTANDNLLTAENSVYSLKIEQDTTVKVAEVFEVSPSLSGEGTSESPYLIASARDINYMASMVNSGNSQYVLAYYALSGDIDCGGKSLDVIGDGSGSASFFGGYFDGKNYTVSNYVINAVGVDFAGLFGYVQASGTGDDLGTVTNLNLKDFTINAFPADGKNVSVGSFIGYGYAANLLVGSATNGKINVFGNNYFCYVGGAVGIQQSASTASDGSLYPFYSAVNYVHTDVDIYCGTGYVYAAGGITGYLFSDNEMTTASVSNCYSEGDIFGVIRAGGIVGMLGDYSSVANCYSTGELGAYVDLDTDDKDYMALAGGIAGYAGVNGIISDSFSTATLYADSINGTGFEKTDGILAYSKENAVNEYGTTVYNCYSGNDAKGTSSSFIKNDLKWNSVDWVITDGSLPAINYGTVEEHKFNVNYDFGSKKVSDATTKTQEISITQNYYTPLCDYFRYEQNGLKEVFASDDDNTSYGYFFDAGYTKRVPYGYILTREITFYVGFADYKDVEGTYCFDKNGRTVTLTLEKDGGYVYVDGVTYESAYTYDGSKLFFYDAPFARLASLPADYDDPSLYFETYDFVGTKTGGSLKLYDGTYFEESAPLSLAPAASTPSSDAFCGYWEKSATINKVYYFDGAGNWTYSVNGEKKSQGTYSVANGVADLGGGVEVSVHKSGLLSVKEGGKEEYYCYRGSLFGTWFDRATGNYLAIEGYGSSLSGDLIISVDGTPSALRYVKDDFFGENCFTLLSGTSLYGYLKLNPDNTLTGVLYSSAAGGFTEGNTFYLIDNFTGEWIGESSVDGVDFGAIDFNGFGIYEVTVAEGLTENLGTLTIHTADGKEVECEYKLNAGNVLEGQFVYNGKTYTLTFDDKSGVVKINGTAELQRKDELYEYMLVDDDGVTYEFNGGGNLNKGGILTITDTDGNAEEIGYKITGGKIADKSLQVTLLNINSGAESGSLTISSNRFAFTRTGSPRKYLDIKTAYTGTWAVSGFMYSFTVGNFDLGLTSSGKFMDMSSTATYEYFPDNNYVRLSYISDKMTQPVSIYLIYIEDGNLAVSSYPYLVAGDYYYASPRDEFMGAWYNSEDRNRTLQFDGLADSKYSYGIAFDSTQNVTYLYTRRFGKIYMWEHDNDENVFVIEYRAFTATGENIFNNGTRTAFEIVEFDETAKSVLTVSHEDSEYKFYFDGSIEVGGRFGTYELISVDGNITRLVIHLPGEDDVYAEVDYEKESIIFD